jgi:hypothetical protein
MDQHAINTLTQLGVINKLSFGNMYIDVLACILFPLLLKHFMPAFSNFRQFLKVCS